MLITSRITSREPEAKETWRAMDEESTNTFKETKFGGWEYGAGDLVKNTEKIIKVRRTKSGCNNVSDSELMHLLSTGYTIVLR